jgi:predicted Fe-S protein YdhL (DUF1289 family)
MVRRNDRRTMTTIETPCVQVCIVDPATSLCTGCGRSLAEIAGWIGFTAAERRRIMAELPGRIAAMQHATTRAKAL